MLNLTVLKPDSITLSRDLVIPILFENHSVIAIDKPPGVFVAPESWNKTGRNLHLELIKSLARGDFWAKHRHLRYIRFIHRLDTETSGILLLAKTPGVLAAISRLFQKRVIQKKYLAVVEGIPKAQTWTCKIPIKPSPSCPKTMTQANNNGLYAETKFKLLCTIANRSLIEAMPLTGRTHQIRIHLSLSGHPIIDDSLYNVQAEPSNAIGLRAYFLSYIDPFRKKPIQILAPTDKFLEHYGFSEQIEIGQITKKLSCSLD